MVSSTVTAATVTSQYHDLPRPQLANCNGIRDSCKQEEDGDCPVDSNHNSDMVLGVSLADRGTSGYKCSAVHSLERDMPDFDYSPLVEELRKKILDENVTKDFWQIDE